MSEKQKIWRRKVFVPANNWFSEETESYWKQA